MSVTLVAPPEFVPGAGDVNATVGAAFDGVTWIVFAVDTRTAPPLS